MVGFVTGAASRELVDVEGGEERVEVCARLLGAHAKEGGEDDGKEGAAEIDAAGQVFGILLSGACGEEG